MYCWCRCCKPGSRVSGSTAASVHRSRYAARGSNSRRRAVCPSPAICRRAIDHAYRSRPARREPCPPATQGPPIEPHARLSSRASAEVVKHLYAPMNRIHHVDPVAAIDCQAGGQLEISHTRVLSEVIKEMPFAIEDLHHVIESVGHVQMAFRVHADAFWTVKVAAALARTSDCVAEAARAIQHLNAEIHGVDHDEVRAIQAQFGRKVEFAVAVPALADGLDHAALHVEHVDLAAPGVGDKDALRVRIHGDSSGV